MGSSHSIENITGYEHGSENYEFLDLLLSTPVKEVRLNKVIFDIIHSLEHDSLLYDYIRILFNGNKLPKPFYNNIIKHILALLDWTDIPLTYVINIMDSAFIAKKSNMMFMLGLFVIEPKHYCMIVDMEFSTRNLVASIDTDCIYHYINEEEGTDILLSCKLQTLGGAYDKKTSIVYPIDKVYLLKIKDNLLRLLGFRNDVEVLMQTDEVQKNRNIL